MNYLVAAYIILWLVHLGYVWSLSSRQQRLKEDLEDLERRTKN